MASTLPGLERLFKALADTTRLRILGLLLTGEVCVCHIHESLRVPQSKASRHLAYLRRAGLVETRRDGVWIHYRLADASDPALHTIRVALTRTLGRVDVVRRDAGRLAGTLDARHHGLEMGAAGDLGDHPAEARVLVHAAGDRVREQRVATHDADPRLVAGGLDPEDQGLVGHATSSFSRTTAVVPSA
jgi:ArsR family transcriptional regulator